MIFKPRYVRSRLEPGRARWRALFVPQFWRGLYQSVTYTSPAQPFKKIRSLQPKPRRPNPFGAQFWRAVYGSSTIVPGAKPLKPVRGLQPKPRKPNPFNAQFWRAGYVTSTDLYVNIPPGRITIRGYPVSFPSVPAGKIIIRGYAPTLPPVIPTGKIIIRGIPVLFAGAVAVPAGKLIITGKVPTLTNYVDNAGQVSCCTVPDESIGGVAAELDNWAL